MVGLPLCPFLGLSVEVGYTPCRIAQLGVRLALGVIWRCSILLVNTARRERLAGLTGRLVGGWEACRGRLRGALRCRSETPGAGQVPTSL